MTIKHLDIFRNIVAIPFTIFVIYNIWEWSWILAILGAVPIYFLAILLIVFLTFPIQRFTVEYKLKKDKKESERLVDNNEFKSTIIKEKKEFNPNINKEKKEFNPKEYSENNFIFARKLIENLNPNNSGSEFSYIKSYKSLKFSKQSIELAFNYLRDSVKFDENCPIYQNVEMSTKLNELHTAMLMTYVEDEIEYIPIQLTEQIKFKAQRKIDVGKNQIEITELIGWRTKDQWQYFLNEFGGETGLGQVCQRKITFANNV